MTVTILSIVFAISCAAAVWRVRSEERRRSAARVAALASAIGANDSDARGAASEQPVAVASLFDGPAGVPSGRHWAQAVAVALLLVALGGVTFALRRPPAGPTGAAATDQVALELMSMRHVNRAGAFTVTGLVRNPPNGAALTRVDAVVFAFDRGGEFVTSGDAPLDLPVIHPGEESPFSVTLQDAAGVARYRVSFRTSEGPLRHVDHRTARQLATVQP